MRTILIRFSGYSEEALAAEAGIAPGMLLERTSDDEFQMHATAAGSISSLLIARENELEGEGVSDSYEDAEQVLAVVPKTGDKIGILVAAGETVVIGDKLESAGDGTWQAATTHANDGQHKVIAREAVAAPASNTLIVAEVL